MKEGQTFVSAFFIIMYAKTNPYQENNEAKEEIFCSQEKEDCQEMGSTQLAVSCTESTDRCSF